MRTYIINKVFRNKKNYFYILLLSILNILLIFVINYKNNFFKKLYDDFENNIQGRTLLISPNDIGDMTLEEFTNFKYDVEKIRKYDEDLIEYISQSLSWNEKYLY